MHELLSETTGGVPGLEMSFGLHVDASTTPCELHVHCACSSLLHLASAVQPGAAASGHSPSLAGGAVVGTGVGNTLVDGGLGVPPKGDGVGFYSQNKIHQHVFNCFF